MTGNTGSTDTSLTSFFKRHLGERYQLMLATLQNWVSTQVKTTSTVVNQQFYHNPPGVVNIETITVTIGSVKYTLLPVDSQLDWDTLNAVTFSGTAIPSKYFPRRDDFGIWPIPQGVYTLTLTHAIRDRNLTNADYATGTVAVTNGSQTVTGTGTSWTNAMAGRWFTDSNDGYWYRIQTVNGGGSLTLESAYVGTSSSGDGYRIGESPELPEEGHHLLPYGIAADWYLGVRHDVGQGNAFNNFFWTGDYGNPDREGDNVAGGLIGLQKRYAARSNSRIVRRLPQKQLTNTILFGSKIT